MKRGASPKTAGHEAPLYLTLARILREEIVGGTWPVGARLPTEDALCGRFGVSRHTVREALRLLRDDGLVISRRGAGTTVLPPAAQGPDMHQVMSVNDLLAFASSTRFDIERIATVTVSRRLATRTGLAQGEQWLAVEGYRHAVADGAPLCRTEYYIHRSFASVGRILQRHQGPIFPLIEDMFGQTISEVQQRISAVLLPAEFAQRLGMSEASAALEVRRSYRTARELLAQVTINTHPATRFQHSMTMRRLKP